MTFYVLAGESVVEMVKDLEEVLHALVPLEMGDNGNPRSIWGNPSPGQLGLVLIITVGETSPDREILQQHDGGVKKQPRLAEMSGTHGKHFKIPSVPRGCPGRGPEGRWCPAKGMLSGNLMWISCAGGCGNRSRVSGTSSVGQCPQQRAAGTGAKGPEVSSLMPEWRTHMSLL